MKKQILIILLAMGSWIAGCGGDSGTETESVVVNDYTNWASLLQNFPVEESSIVLQDGRTISGYKEHPGGKVKAILTLPPSYSLNLEEFYADFNPEKNNFEVRLNESTEDKPKVAFYLEAIYSLNKEKFQNHFDQVQPVTFIRRGENPVNIPVKVVQTSKGEYWLESSLIGSGTYSFAPDTLPAYKPRKKASGFYAPSTPQRRKRQPPLPWNRQPGHQARYSQVRRVLNLAAHSGPATPIAGQQLTIVLNL